ncbi:MAG: hypothetical protein IKD07_07785 [Clostridia bacterium]|nr:hypothetical protein [Clostridia bacterium]
MSKEKQIDIIIDLLTEFDEMGFIPSAMVPDTEAYAIKWRERITNAFEEYRKQSEGENIAKYSESFECSVCHFSDWDTKTADKTVYNFCPHCGAKMKGE